MVDRQHEQRGRLHLGYNQAMGHVGAALLVLTDHRVEEAYAFLSLLFAALPLDFYGDGSSGALQGVLVEVRTL